jgi:hypothetical protein
MEFFVLYLFVMLEQISGLFSKLGGFLLILMFISALISPLIWLALSDSFTQDEIKKMATKPIKCFKVAIGLTVVCFLLENLLPTPKQAAVIFGGGMAYKAVTSDKGQEVLGKVGSKVEQELDRLLSTAEEKTVGAATK